MERLERYTMSLEEWIRSKKLDRLVYTRRGWFNLFCRFCMKERRPFYWEFRDVLITVVPRERESLLISERVLSGRRRTFRRNEWILPSRRVCEMIGSLYGRLPRSEDTSTRKSRNTQASRAILSFRGFLDQLLHNGARLIDDISERNIVEDRGVMISFFDALVEYGVINRDMARSDDPATRS